LVYFVIVWYILIRFGMLYHEKSGNPDWKDDSAFPFFRFTVSKGQRSLLEKFPPWSRGKMSSWILPKVSLQFLKRTHHLHGPL
jgi:hypothetical protein